MDTKYLHRKKEYKFSGQNFSSDFSFCFYMILSVSPARGRVTPMIVGVRPVSFCMSRLDCVRITVSRYKNPRTILAFFKSDSIYKMLNIEGGT